MKESVRQALNALMATQHGLVTLEQLDRMDVTRGQLRAAIGQGWMCRAGPRVYALAAAPRTVDYRRRLGLLVHGKDAVLSHRGAARLHHFDRSSDSIVEFTVLRGHRPGRSQFRVHTTATLPAIDRVVVAGFACTSATRTVIDLARLRVSRFMLEAAIDSAVRAELSSPVVLAERLAELRGPGRWGARLLDELLVDSGGHTMLERRFLGLVRRAGLPRPRTQVIHRREGRAVARVDFLFDEHSVVVEVSGSKGHSSPSERARDAQRRNELQDAGRCVYEYTWEHVTRRSDWVVGTLQSRVGAATSLT